MPLGGQSHGDEGDGDLLAGGEELIHFAFGGLAGGGAPDVFRQGDEFVGGVAHGRDDDDDLVAGLLGSDDFLGGPVDFFCRGDRRATELLDDDSHTFWYLKMSGAV